MTILPRSVTSDAARLEALRELEILDTLPEPSFDRLVEMAKSICNTPVALISLVADERQWFKARSGFEPCETGMESSVCAHTIAQGTTLIVPDLTIDPRTRDNPLVTGEPYIRFYAGAVLRTSAGIPIGSFCVIDTTPRPEGLNCQQVDLLEGLAEQAIDLIEMRAAILRREQSNTFDRGAAARSLQAAQAGRLGTFDVDLASDVITVSPEGCRIFGLAIQPTYPSSAFEALLLPEDARYRSSLQDRQEGTSKSVAEYRIRRAHDGALRWIARRGDFITREDGEPVRFAGTLSDITERKLLELRQKLLIEVSEVVRNTDEKPALLKRVTEMLGKNLGVARVTYSAVDLRSGMFDIRGEWHAPTVDPMSGLSSLAPFEATTRLLGDGRTLAIANVPMTDSLAPDSEGYERIGVASLVAVPLVLRRELAAVFVVHESRPRTWTPEEIVFIEAVAELVYAGASRLKAEEQQRLLNEELSHRLKNTLAMVAAIAKQTLKGVTERDAVEGFLSRILALSSAHDVLLQTSWTSARIKAVVEGVVALHAKPGRLTVSGPDIRLGPKAALSISMLLHELGTNAIKYGALSVEGGQVNVSWTVNTEGDEAQLHLTWREIGGPAAIEPQRRGFGSRLISSGISGTADVQLSYEQTGLVADFRAPMRLVTQH